MNTDCARLTVRHQDLVQSVDVTVAPDGQPTQVRFDRWSKANTEKQHQLQPFGSISPNFSHLPDTACPRTWKRETILVQITIFRFLWRR
ncbi:MAG: hypothetical protein U9P10_05020 [Thermodesulfobacteriota bacterium]|nr:hypothetical protein [Thermodesulfobacteriota bacterium]